MTTIQLIAASLLAGAVALVVYGLARGRQEDELATRLNRYGAGAGWAEAHTPNAGPRSPRDAIRGLTDALNPLLDRTATSGKLAEELARADLKLKSSEWVLAVAGSGVLLGLLLALRFGNPLVFLVGPPVAWFASGFILRFLQNRRARLFNRQLGDTIILLSNALKAGFSFAQALATVAKNASSPIAEEFSRATREIQLGINVDDALTHMVERNKSEDFDLMVTAVQIQRVVGGNLAEILDTISHTIRERVRIHGEIRTLTAQARASGWIILVLPIALAGILSVISPTYFRPMFSETIGQVMLATGVVMMAIGYAIVQKITKIEV
ncbi:MAG: type II secretion system F family protein [Candidatus Dormibacteria bacterium]